MRSQRLSASDANQTSPAGDERQSKGSQALARPTASKRVGSPPGREHPLHVDVTDERNHNSKPRSNRNVASG
jgi:hypothetical protein